MKKWLIGSALALVALGGVAVAQVDVFRLYTSLTGNEVVNDMANPTGAQFTTKVLVTQGLANIAQTTVAALPTCNSASKGYLYEVTDASSPTFGGTLTGSSTTFTLAACNGTNWVAQ